MSDNKILQLQKEVSESVKKLRDLGFLVKVSYSGEFDINKLSTVVEFVTIEHQQRSSDEFIDDGSLRNVILDAKKRGDKFEVQKLQQKAG